MTDAQFNQLMSLLRSIDSTIIYFSDYLNDIRENVFALVCIAMIGLSLWIGFKVLKPYLFRV